MRKNKRKKLATKWPYILLIGLLGLGGGWWLGSQHEQHHPAYTHATKAASQNIHCRVCFTPGENCLALILQSLRETKSSVYVMAYALTSAPIAKELITARKRGVTIIVLADKSQLFDKRSQVRNLAQAGAVVYIDYRPKIQHNKVMILDRQTVISGSYNWTESAEKRNAENLIIIKNTAVATQYLQNFEKRQKASRLMVETQITPRAVKSKPKTC